VQFPCELTEPVRGGGETNTTRTDGQREDLADNDPSAGAPGGGEEEDVDTDERDHSLDSLRVVTVDSASNTDDELADDHTKSAPDEQWTTAKPLNSPEGDRGGADVDEGGDEGDQERVLNGAEILEEGGTEVEDEVDTSPLLHHLERSTEDSAAQVAVGLPERSLEAVHPAAQVAVLGDDLHLVLVVGNDLSQFLLNVLRVTGLATDAGKRMGGPVELTTLDEVTRRFWESEKTTSQDQSPKNLNGNGNAVRSGSETLLGGVGDARRKQQADGDAELVTGDDGTTDLARRDLGHVQNNNGRDETDTETSDQTADDEQGNGGRGNLETDTEDEDTAASNDGSATTEEIGKITSNDSTEECTSGQDRRDKRLLRGRHGEAIVVVASGIWVIAEFMDEVLHAHDTVDVTRIIPEKDLADALAVSIGGRDKRGS